MFKQHDKRDLVICSMNLLTCNLIEVFVCIDIVSIQESFESNNL